ncbi:MAG TPA: Uma2 family endonuclease [Bacillota bacterium]|nr:Uma2 family endonuclease [Bacillota bacterium]
MPHRTIFTYREYALMPEGPRYEVLGGDLVGLPAPSTAHQEVIGALHLALRTWANGSRAGQVFISPIDVRLSDTDVVQPDLLFVAAARRAIIEAPYVRAAPDLVIEVLSLSTAERDRVVKRAIYERHGVREYWIVDPDARSVDILTYGKDGLQLRRTEPSGATLASELLPGLALPVASIFAGLDA